MASTPIPSPELTQIATRVIAGLIGWRWTWPRRTVQEVYRIPYGCSSLLLYGRPTSQADVASVVDINGNPITPFEVSNGYRVDFPSWWGSTGIWTDTNWPPLPYLFPGQYQRVGFTKITVVYTYGSPPPLDIQRAIDQLARQFALAECGQQCQLPERVTNVTREGVSWTLIDPQDFLDNGRTGLYFVDLILKTYTGAPARSAVWSPERGVPRRLSSVQVTV